MNTEAFNQLVTADGLKVFMDDFLFDKGTAPNTRYEDEELLSRLAYNRINSQWAPYSAVATPSRIRTDFGSESIALLVAPEDGLITVAGIQETELGQALFAPRSGGWKSVVPLNHGSNELVIAPMDFKDDEARAAVIKAAKPFQTVVLNIAEIAAMHTTIRYGGLQPMYAGEAQKIGWHATTRPFKDNKFVMPALTKA